MPDDDNIERGSINIFFSPQPDTKMIMPHDKEFIPIQQIDKDFIPENFRIENNWCNGEEYIEFYKRTIGNYIKNVSTKK